MGAEKRNASIYINGAEVKNTMQQIEASARKLRGEIRHLVVGSEEYEQKMRELGKLNAQIDGHRKKMRGVSTTWEKLKTNAKAYGAMALAAFTAQRVIRGIADQVKKLADLSDAYADVSRTTGMSIQQVKQLDKELMKLNTRTSRKQLLELAKEAGKLGISGTANLRKFVEQADQINVALGEDLGEGALITMGKLANIFKTDMLNIASAINEVGASSVASESYQVDFLQRLAGVAETAQLSLPDILGYGAALENLGQTAEVSGTAMNQLFLKLIKNTEEFGRIAGFATGELSELIGEQGTSAGMAAFLERLKDGSVSTQDLALKLEELGVDGVRAAGVLLTLANNTEVVAEQQAIANQAFQEGTSVTDEFNRKNETLAASFDRFTKRMQQFATDNVIVQGLANLTQGFIDLVAPVQKTSVLIDEERVRLNMLVGAIQNTNTNNKLRQQYIDEIKQSYPEFNELVKGDYNNHQLLTKALKQVNQEYVNKIILQRQGEEYEKAAIEQAEAFIKMEQVQARLQRRIAQNGGVLGITQRENETLQEFQQRIDYLYNRGDFTRNERATLDLLSADVESLIKSIENYEQAERKAGEAATERARLQEKLGELLQPGGDMGSNPELQLIDEISLAAGEAETKLQAVHSELSSIYKEVGDERIKASTDPLGLIRQKEKELELLRENKLLQEELMATMQAAMDVQDEAAEQWLANNALVVDSITQVLIHQKSQIEMMALQGLQIAENTKSQAEATQQILANFRAEIKAIIAKAIAGYIADLLIKGTGLGPFGLAAAGGLAALAGATIGNIFDSVVPQFAAGGYANVVGAQTGKPYRAQVDQRFSGGYVSKPLLVGEEGAEYTVPAWMMSNPAIVDQVEALEAIRTGAAGVKAGGGSTVNNSSTVNNISNYSSDKELLTAVLAYLKRQPIAVIGDQAIIDMQTRLSTLTQLETKAKR